MSKGGSSVSIPSNYTLGVGGTSSPLQVDLDLQPVTVNSNLAVIQPVVTQSTSNGTATSTSSLELKVDPVEVKVDPLDLKIEPLSVESDSKSLIDLKPVVVDSCQTIRLAPLPPIHMEQPYSQHFGITYMGMEILGFNLSGTSVMKLHTPKNVHPCPPCEQEKEPTRRSVQPVSDAPRGAGGLRVRVDD